MTKTEYHRLLEVESNEINGARNLLLKLMHEYGFLLVPSVMHTHKTETNYDGTPKTAYFPLNPKYRKLAGEGMIRWLLAEKENMRKYLYNDIELYAKYITNDKGKVIRIDIHTKDNP